jgi:hypothetical protein
MIIQAWHIFDIIKEAVGGFLADDAISHSAAMAFFAVTALSPVLLIVVAIAGLAFGHDASQVALSAQLSGLMEPQGPRDIFYGPASPLEPIAAVRCDHGKCLWWFRIFRLPQREKGSW